MKKEQFTDWWKQDKRYLTLVKAVLMALLPVVCCLVRSARCICLLRNGTMNCFILNRWKAL